MVRRTRRESRPIPAHPYRDTAVVYAVMALLLVVLAWLTGGDAVRAVLVAAAFFVVATAWSWWKFRRRISERVAAGASVRADPPDEAQPNGDGTGGAV